MTQKTHILITGATGLIGKKLVERLLTENYRVTALVRDIKRAQTLFSSNISLLHLNQLSTLDEYQGIINLAGEPIFAKRWTPARKKLLTESRVALTETLSRLINFSKNSPHFFISGSATGYYGDQGDQIINENSPPTNQFTGQLCQQWENAALQTNTRVCLLRTGMVFSTQDGALAQMLPFYRLGLGGKLGNGQQFVPWINIEDMINGIMFLIQNTNCQGAFNFTSPNPVRNQELNKLLAKAVKRPAFCHPPSALLRLILGERANLLLDSQNVHPTRLLRQGFQFKTEFLPQFLKNNGLF